VNSDDLTDAALFSSGDTGVGGDSTLADGSPGDSSTVRPSGLEGGADEVGADVCSVQVTTPSSVQCTLLARVELPQHVLAVEQHIPGIWILETGTSGQVFVVSQVASDPSNFLLYPFDLSSGTPSAGRPISVSGASKTGVRLYDVGSDMAGPFALTTFDSVSVDGGSLLGLARIPLGLSWPMGSSAGAACRLSEPFPAGGLLAARIVSNTSLWVASVGDTSDPAGQLVVGSGPSDTTRCDQGWAQVGIPTQTAMLSLGRSSPAVLGDRLYVFYDDGTNSGTTVFSVPSDLSSLGTSFRVNVDNPFFAACGGLSAAGPGQVLGAKMSVATPSSAIVLSATSDLAASITQVWSARTPPQALTSLVIPSAPPFARGSLLAPRAVPSQYPASAWIGDDFVVVGNDCSLSDAGGCDSSGRFELLWLRPNGQVAAALPIVDSAYGDEVVAAALQVRGPAQSTSAVLDVAWIVRWPCVSATNCPERVVAASFACAASSDGG
jgi:hypothetical protein